MAIRKKVKVSKGVVVENDSAVDGLTGGGAMLGAQASAPDPGESFEAERRYQSELKKKDRANARRPVEGPRHPKTGEILPHRKDVDARKISAPVRTAEGWLMPAPKK